MRRRVQNSVTVRFLKDTRGVAAVIWAIVLGMVIGGLGLGTDVTTWYLGDRNLQNATDAAAMSVGYDIDNASSASEMESTANDELTRNGISGASVTINYPPQSGSYAGNLRAAELVVTQPRARLFTKYFLDTDPTVRARTVVFRQSNGSACVLALETLKADALLFQGNTSVNLNNCIAASNSSHNDSITVGGSSVLNAETIYTVGSYDVAGNNAELTTNTPPVTNAQPLTDPFQSLSVPAPASCVAERTSLTVNDTRVLEPGTYCNGLRFNSQANVTLSPGTYIIDRDSFKIVGGARVTGEGVTIVLTSSTGSSYASVDIAGGAYVTISAPTTGDLKGVAVFQDPNAPSGNNLVNKFNGGSTTEFEGALYFPSQEVQFTGNNDNGDGGACTKIVAKIITFTGNSDMSNNCPASVKDIFVPGVVQMVE